MMMKSVQVVLLTIFALVNVATSTFNNNNNIAFVVEESDCQKEFKKVCGKQLDTLKELIHAEDKNIKAIVNAAKAVAKCAYDKREDLKSKCSPHDLSIMTQNSDFSLNNALTTVSSSSSMFYGSPCDDIVTKLCGDEMKKLEQLLLSGAEPQDIVRGCRDLINCLIKNDAEIAKYCNNNNVIAAKQQQDDHNKCSEFVHKRCKKQIDELEKAIEDTSIVGIVSGAFAVASCIIDNAQDIWEKCKPFDQVYIAPADQQQAYDLPLKKGDDESKCHKALYSKCGKQLNQLKQTIKDVSVLGMWGSSLEAAGCITENAQYLVKECIPIGEQATALAQIAPGKNYQIAQPRLGEQEDGGQCKKVLRHYCGKQFDALKKEIEETSINGILSATFAVASCLTENFRDIIAKCSPFDEPKFGGAAIIEFNTIVASDDKESKCHKALYKRCGDDIKELKEGIKNTAVLEIVGSSLKLHGCVIRNFQELLSECLSHKTESMTVLNTANNNNNNVLAANIQSCVENAKSDCSEQYEAVKQDIEEHRFDQFIDDISELSQCIADHQDNNNNNKQCVKNLMDVATRAMFESHRRHHHHSSNDDDKSSALQVFNGEVANDEFYIELQQPIFKGGRHHFHHVMFPILISVFLFFAGFATARRCNGRTTRCCCRKQQPVTNNGSLQYEPLNAVADNDLKVHLTSSA